MCTALTSYPGGPGPPGPRSSAPPSSRSPSRSPSTAAWPCSRDPAGVLFALWEATGIGGYGAVDEPGLPCWQDCITPDVDASARFYADLFGCTMSDEVGPDVRLTRLGEDGHFTVGRFAHLATPGGAPFGLFEGNGEQADA